jgi:hypothetical protein
VIFGGLNVLIKRQSNSNALGASSFTVESIAAFTGIEIVPASKTLADAAPGHVVQTRKLIGQQTFVLLSVDKTYHRQIAVLNDEDQWSYFFEIRLCRGLGKLFDFILETRIKTPKTFRSDISGFARIYKYAMQCGIPSTHNVCSLLPTGQVENRQAQIEKARSTLHGRFGLQPKNAL